MHEVSKRVLFRALLKGGMSKSAISRELGISRRTATRWAAADGAGRGSEALTYGPRAAVPSVLDAYQEIVRVRLSEYPDLSSERLFRELRESGYQGGYDVVNWLGNRNFLARLRRAAASSDWSLLIVKGGRAPLSHFPPGHAGVKPSGFAAMSFFLVRRTAVSRRDPSGRSDESRRGSSSASRRPSEVRREPHGDPGAGGDGVGEPDSQPLLARESKLPCPPPAGCGKFRLVVADCERGACPPFTLSPRTRWRQTLRVRRHEFFPRSAHRSLTPRSIRQVGRVPQGVVQRFAPAFRSAARAARRPRSGRGWGRGTRLPAAPGSGIETSLPASGGLRQVPIGRC